MDQTREAKKEYLSRYRSAVRQMAQARARLEDLREFSSNVAACISGIPAAKGSFASKVEIAVEQLERAQEKYLDQFTEALRIREDVETAIEQLEKQSYRDILYQRYIHGLTVVQIAETMHRDERWIRRLINLAVDQLELPGVEAGEEGEC